MISLPVRVQVASAVYTGAAHFQARPQKGEVVFLAGRRERYVVERFAHMPINAIETPPRGTPTVMLFVALEGKLTDAALPEVHEALISWGFVQRA